MKRNTRTVEGLKIITNKEIQILIIVMHKYNIQLVNAERVRGAYKVTTDIGNFRLKKMKHGRNKAKNGCILTEELIFNGFSNIAKYFRSKEGDFYVKYKSNIFYLTEWIDGSECDLTDIDEAINCVKLLAEFHNISNKIDHNKIHIEKNLNNWPKIFTSNLNNLEKFKNTIISKRIKNDFDVLFLEEFDNFYTRGLSAINMLNKSQYYKFSKIAYDSKSICHNSFYNQNIIKKEGEYFITDLDSIIIDMQISDLGTLIRRLMFKKSYGWDFNFAKALIEAYNSINSLCKEDLEIMFALIIFPQKFYKLGYRRYINQKKWSETKYLHKLNKIVSYNENQEKFFEDYLIFLEEYL